MNILLFGGFLGSGKTSVVLQTAKYLVGNKQKVAIVENEIGEVGIDDKVIAAQGLAVKGIYAGCVCCQISGDLVLAIREIHQTVDPDWLIIETTGLAVPSKVVEFLQKYCDCYDELRTIVLVDAERWEELYEVTEDFVVSQVKSADTLIISKIDLIDDSYQNFLVELMKQINSKATALFINAAQEIPGKILQKLVEL